ncbi:MULTISPECIES: AAA family ATPase [unclassified Streptomyces]|uniref:AAA family ATPase n=1 Tax=unclassified Streptomyces TaxID=2593676 RepID=UPI0003755E43|nr:MULTISPECIES: AAA family ATPase [unclassified Streptomyces]MYT34058.1 AAA family ATPase [Streptomyces sp. SID8354]
MTADSNRPAGQTAPGCLIVSGMPGAGKSTVSPLVAAHHERAAHINGDFLSYMVVQGRVGFLGRPAAESRRQLLLCARNMCTLANNFAEQDIFPVVEYAIADRELLDFMAELLLPRPVMFVVLAPPPEVCRQRNAARPARERVDYDIAPFYRAMHEELNGVGWWLDSSGQTPEETAAAIAAEARHRAVLAAGHRS